MDLGDIVALSEGILITGTWAWVLHKKSRWSGWREHLSLWGFVCATIAIAADLLLTFVMHLRGDSKVAGTLFLVALLVGILLGSAGLVLGMLGRGSPKIAALLWSLLVLLLVALTAITGMRAVTE